MHRLRAAVFRERLAWDVTITDAGERDEHYDDLTISIGPTTRSSSSGQAVGDQG
ncbi:acyl-homoserine-lactone synthase [Rhizobium leguminosarum]|uniref:Acyl-homoserine-lactone synthase n=1 Tax=Rhizobium leguminosarum TaxID=384 RepID=A0A7K3VUA6_RHILE|nr:hypothetical protein [Rhizobium leguminosarum]